MTIGSFVLLGIAGALAGGASTGSWQQFGLVMVSCILAYTAGVIGC